MAEAFLRIHGGDRFDPLSAGLEPVPIDPLTIEVMREKGVELESEGHRSKGLVEEFFSRQVHIGYLITVCRHAESNCPIYPWAGIREFWDIEDPAAFRGTEVEKLECFRRIRDEVELKVVDFVRRRGPDQKD
jgi:arsenate reductase